MIGAHATDAYGAPFGASIPPIAHFIDRERTGHDDT